MRDSAVRPEIGQHIAMDALANAIEKKWRGGYEVRAGAVIFAELWVFQKGAILGRAKRDKVNSLASLMAAEGGEKQTLKYLNNAAGELQKEYGKEPASFFDLFMLLRFPSIDFSDIKWLKTLSRKKYRLGEVLPNFQFDTVQGIGLGVGLPDLVKKLWVESYEKKIDQATWTNAREYGLDIPETQSILTLKDMEKIVLQEVSDFVNEYHPDLVPHLGL